jgi:hypothetical protein
VTPVGWYTNNGTFQSPNPGGADMPPGYVPDRSWVDSDVASMMNSQQPSFAFGYQPQPAACRSLIDINNQYNGGLHGNSPTGSYAVVGYPAFTVGESTVYAEQLPNQTQPYHERTSANNSQSLQVNGTDRESRKDRHGEWHGVLLSPFG